MKTHPAWIDNFDLAHPLLIFPGRSPFVAQKAELHVLGGDRFAVVKLDAGAKRELVDHFIGTLRIGFGQARRHASLGHGLKERTMQALLHHVRRDNAGIQAGSEPGRGQRHMHRIGEFPFGFAGGHALADETRHAKRQEKRNTLDPSPSHEYASCLHKPLLHA